MERPKNNNWLDEALSETIGPEKPRTDFEEWKKNHSEAVEMLTSRAGRGLSTSKSPLNIRKIIMKSPITKLAAAAVIILVVFIGADQFWTNGSSIAWADVAERFESVPFFNLTIYIGNDTSAEAKKIEIWKSEDSRARVREENKVIFADFSNGKKEIIAFDQSTKEAMNVNGVTAILLGTLGSEKRFSLDTLVSALSSEALDMVSVESAETAASKEIVVFEAKRKTTGEGLRIWALRASKLPIQMQFRDPRNSERGDFLFDYSEKKDDTFFDPNVFKNQK